MRLYGWIIALSLLASQAASAAVLYQPSGTQFPEDQGWLFYGALGTVTTKSADSTRTTLNTGDNGAQAGWSNTIPFLNTLVNSSFPTLDRANGFSLTFGVKLNSESHASNNRAGFSVILLSSDHRGVELGFWTDEIWAQNADFTHGDSTGAYDATVQRQYTLSILDSAYTLNDGTSDILTGSLRDYSTSMSTPYDLNNYLFFGDDTTSATASFDLTGATITVPEPAGIFLLGAAVLLGIPRRRRG
jgi:hypothetical protein